MTRINLVSPMELSDQHLIAEYRELPRCIKQKIDTSDAPEQYCLGKGHMKWAKKHSFFLLKRYGYILDELIYRGFKISHSFDELHYLYSELTKPEDENDYFPTSADIELSRNRISERINKKPNFYRWTKRDKKEYVPSLKGEIDVVA